MNLSTEDRARILDLINLHGHLTDDGELDRLGELFADDVVYDITVLGGGVLEGLRAVQDAALALGAENPIAHHVTNVVITHGSDGVVRAVSKGLGVNADGGVGSVTYEDVLVHRNHGWLISRRTVRARRTPLTR